MRDPLADMINAGPRWQRPGKRALLALGRRPRGIALLKRLTPADHAAAGLVALARYDDPEVARSLGWDADAVATRGRMLRREEGRP
jgi:hypothetical protein